MAAPTRPHPYFENLGWSLQPTDAGLARVWLLGRYPIKIRPELVEAVQAMEQALILHSYENPCDYTGSWMYRAIAGTNGLASGHAYGVCIDLDYGGDTDGDGDPTIDKNPHVHRPIVPGDPGFGVEWQITEAQVNAIEAIRTTAGEQVWTWRIGWGYGDTMHWEPAVGPDLAPIDWRTVTGPEDDEVFNEWVEGWATGLAEDKTKTRQEFTRLNTVPAADGGYILEPPNSTATVDYWVKKLDTPAHPEWRGFYARTGLSTWGR